MLSKLFKSNIDKLKKALLKEDLKGFREILNRVDPADLSAASTQLIEAAIHESAPDYLESLLQKLQISDTEKLLNYGLLACTTEQPIKTLRVLLREGLNRISNQQINQLSRFIVNNRESDRMALLSLVSQHGCDLNGATEAIVFAIKNEDRELMKFLIESGVRLNEQQLTEASETFQSYASRIVADKTLRDSWL
ncbi:MULTISPECIES: hypothetical protein [unclassified Marinobacterium]|jgi:hypothetical protein|uniref:hypothetical protein n=1 Tax=unclassified Marinobacterium TaxID=2644139 RepID=UPI001567D564|nr:MULTISPECIES: hypothetical protein [unclassified Marinobacterium]NRP16438.1 hypothetical protein [Marinobacterium sp. xm-a-152]NRP28301.1 hypothetical protein [Marinobacterium sp. xm-d-420]NRP35301.1 hypothetical protein [Marinobacterium sp. xm-d-579]NRP46409.1 hypothetical protein [Marinobacterium sp. xm-d-543]NRP53673.1 hypothetical protein [Marinobacterium sp. xm-v-242]